MQQKSLIEVRCEECKKAFQKSVYKMLRQERHFCSRKCYGMWRRNHTFKKSCRDGDNRVKVRCEICDKEFIKTKTAIKKTKHNFCGLECYGKYVSDNKKGENNPTYQRVVVSCTFCGSDVVKKRYRLTRSDKLFCNRSCYAKWQEQQTGVLNPTFKRYVVYCDGCGKELLITKYQIDHWSVHFCDQACRGVWQSRVWVGETHPRWTSKFFCCEICGKRMKRQQWEITDKDRHFCSRKCYGVWQSQHRVGENNPAWRGGDIDYYGPNWHNQRRAARKRDKHRCRHCGITEKKLGHELDVHHIQPFRTFGYIPELNDHYLAANTLSNLISLCKHCHRLAEYEHIPMQLGLC